MTPQPFVSRFARGFCILSAALLWTAQAHAEPFAIVGGKSAISRTALGSVEGTEGSSITLTAPKAAKGATYSWDLNRDGKYETKGRRVTILFADNGTYAVRYRILPKAKKGSRNAKRYTKGSKRIAISNLAPTADVGGPYSGSTGQAVRFHGSASDRGLDDRRAGYNYIWNFGDGSPVLQRADLTSPTHTYSSTGTYSVSLVTRDKDGGQSASSVTSVSIGQTSQPPPGATPPGPTPPAASGPLTTVNPVEFTGDLANPGMGWQSADRVNTSGQDAQGFKNKVAYIKYYWKDLQTAENTYNWSTFDQRLTQAHNSGQKVAFRIVVVDNITGGPTWLRNMGAAGTMIRYYGDGGSAPQVWSPTLSDPTFLQKHNQFLRAMALRYDGHPDIDSIDIGSVGLWGEWHFWSVTPTIPLSDSTNRTIIDHYTTNFTRTPLVAQLENQPGLAYAVSKGAGFRGDCLGYIDNQMRYLYEPHIQSAQAQNAWKRGPINFETCWDISRWVNNGWDVHYVFQWALDRHISGLNNKNARVPTAAVPEVQWLLKKMGYRYVLRQLRHVTKAHAGDSVTVSMTWDNIGVAPSYSPYVLAFQLKDTTGRVVASKITQDQVKQWLPGVSLVDDSFVMPASLAKGTYTLALAIVDPTSGQPQVQLSINGRDSSGWYPLSSITIE